MRVSYRTRAARELRATIAQLAARMLAEGDARTIANARTKAAERLGAADARALPSNQEIAEALASYQRLFEGDRSRERLRRLRDVALNAMALLAPFSPRLVGPVLSGTATATSPVTLHVFADRAEEVGMFLLERGIQSEHQTRTIRQDPETSVARPVFAFLAGDCPIECVVFPEVGIRQAPLSALDGKPVQRADATALQALQNAEVDQDVAADLWSTEP